MTPADDVNSRAAAFRFHSWTQEEIAKFEERHPIGSKARLALALLMFTGVRRSDVVKFGSKLVKDEALTFMPEKTSKSTAKVLNLPVLPNLRQVIDASPTGSEAYLETERGIPFTANGFGNWFRDRCDEAGLKHCSAHGLRKAGADIAAENGATEAQMMAIFGWSTAAMAAHYHKKASSEEAGGRGDAHAARQVIAGRQCPTLDGGRPRLGTPIQRNQIVIGWMVGEVGRP